MLRGILVEVDSEKQQAKIEQAINKRQYVFDFKLWDGKQKELKIKREVEFDIEKGIVIKVNPKSEPVDPNDIPVVKTLEECIEEFFAQENEILEKYKDFVQGRKRLDFLRSRRFILTAYNNLCEMDSRILDSVLKESKNEILQIHREYENYTKKARYSLEYLFEKVFLNRQSAYLKGQHLVKKTQSLLSNMQAQVNPLARNLEKSELALKSAKTPDEKIDQGVKAMRKRYVDLLQHIADQKDLIVKTTERLKKFQQKHLEEFEETFASMKQIIEDRFLVLLDTKAYDLDFYLWDRAKHSSVVKKFFRDSGIEGGYSSTTFLRYFLRGLDKSKLNAQSKELFSLLRYLEETNSRKVLLIRESSVDSKRDKQIILKVDSCISVQTQEQMIPAFHELCEKDYDIVVMEWCNSNISALEFIKKFRNKRKNAKVSFVVIVPEIQNSDFISKARDLGVEYFVPLHNTDLLADAVRMAL
ncbi:hypothetical protein [Helicobacter sp. 10-6591]|uniref:hypothetical protein n=1 Tax=Helicobacter sp. 10-6591 TaxID=2004998 RepID=UPI000DCB77C8|nr:hypothetical protein [Helicobacter sp. 10-6591]RAX55731.1 hypothetical protein CCY97_03180 [Helicobacter sp. 10-6591]